MRLLRATAIRLRSLVRRRDADADVDAELRYHLARDVERRVAAGMSVRDATAARIPFAEQLGQDIRYAVRGFRVAGGSIIVAVVSTGALAKRLTRNALDGVVPGGSTELHTLEESLAIHVPSRKAVGVDPVETPRD